MQLEIPMPVQPRSKVREHWLTYEAVLILRGHGWQVYRAGRTMHRVGPIRLTGRELIKMARGHHGRGQIPPQTKARGVGEAS